MKKFNNIIEKDADSEKNESIYEQLMTMCDKADKLLVNKKSCCEDVKCDGTPYYEPFGPFKCTYQRDKFLKYISDKYISKSTIINDNYFNYKIKLGRGGDNQSRVFIQIYYNCGTCIDFNECSKCKKQIGSIGLGVKDKTHAEVLSDIKNKLFNEIDIEFQKELKKYSLENE